MRILAIRFARLGDVILLLPALTSLKHRFPGSQLTLLTGHRCAPIAELCPAIDEVLPVDRVAMRDGSKWRAIREIARLVKGVRGRRFDLVIDFHSFRETNLLARLSGAPIRIGLKREAAPYWGFCFNRPAVIEDKSLHVSDMFQKVVASLATAAVGTVPSPPVLRPALSVPQQYAKPTARRIALYVAAPVPERIWPPDRFAAVADFGIERLGAEVVVLSSPERADLAERVQRLSRHGRYLSVSTDLSLPELAGVIGSAQLFISNDTGPMHIGPAIGVRTLGLFSVGYPEHFRPIGNHDNFLRADPIEGIGIEEVLQTVERMWITADRDLRY